MQYRLRRRQWLARNKRVLAGLVAGFAAVCVVEVVLLRATLPPAWFGYVIAVGLTAALMGFCWMLHTMFLASSGDAIHQLRGALGEDNTSDELKRARRRGLVWHWVDGVQLDRADIDHLVVTRQGGVVVIDSKWRSVLDAKVRADVAESVRRTAMRGEALMNTVARRSAGRHRGARPTSTVTAVATIWGAAQSEVAPGGELVDGGHVIRGSDLCSWLATLQDAPMPEDLAVEIIDEIVAFDRHGRSGRMQDA